MRSEVKLCRKSIMDAYFLSMSSSEAHISREHFFVLFFFVSGLYELGRSLMSTTEVEQQWVTVVLGRMTWVALRVVLVDRNPFWPCLSVCLNTNRDYCSSSPHQNMSLILVDRAVVPFNNKGTGITYGDLHRVHLNYNASGTSIFFKRSNYLYLFYIG